MKKILFTLLAMMSVIYAGAQTREIERHIGEIKGGYNYLMARPLNTDTLKPMVIFLHGSSLRGKDLDRVKKYGSIKAVMNGVDIDAYVVAPQLPSGSWDPVKIKEVLDYVANHNNVDDNKIYLIGMSLGGAGVFNYGRVFPESIAAAIAVAGGGTSGDMGELNKLPLWVIHGIADNEVGIFKSDRVVKSMKARDPKTPRLVYDRVPGADHDKPIRLFMIPEFYDWLFLHRLDQPGRPVQQPPLKVTLEVMENAY